MYAPRNLYIINIMKHFIKIIVLVALDQITKWLVNANMLLGKSVDLIPGVFSLTRVENYGAAWNSFEGQKLILIVMPLIVMVIATGYLIKTAKKNSPVMNWSLVLVIAGGIGNQIDRIFAGKVTDMFDFHFWPVFNVADICVVVGAILLCLGILFDKKYDKRN